MPPELVGGPATSRLKRLIGDVDWGNTARELVLIIVGVLVALAVNNWNARRQERSLEARLLIQLRTAVAADLRAIREVHDAAVVRQRRTEALLALLARGSHYADSMDAYFGAPIKVWEIQLNTSPYEVLKAKGLDLIADDSLRLRIVQVYDQRYQDLQTSEGDDRNVIFEVVRPYFLKNFRNVRFGESATPIDYAGIAHDSYFVNVLTYRMASLQANVVGPTQLAMTDLTELTRMLDQAVGH